MIKVLEYTSLIILFIVGSLILVQQPRLSKMLLTPKQPQCVVRVKAERSNESDLGTGVLISSDLVLTAHHVVRQGGKVTVEFKSGLTREAKVVKTSNLWDLALLQFDSVLYIPVQLADKAAVKQDVITIGGFPGSKEYTERSGRVVGFRSPDRNSDDFIFVVGNRCESGMSGGPAFKDGKLVGILFGTLRFANCTGLEAIKEFIYEQSISRQDRTSNSTGSNSKID